MRRSFTFRDVAKHEGIVLSNKVSWGLGKMLVDLSDELGIQRTRLLTKKTDPNPTVAAKHCIAHYPMEMFEEACRRARFMFIEHCGQGDLFNQQKSPAEAGL